MERAIMLSLEKAKEFYAKGGEFRDLALGAYTEEELTEVELPKTWEEFCENYPIKKGECWLDSMDEICTATLCGVSRRHKNWIPSKKSAEAHLAMIQLEQLRNCYRQGWVPDYSDTPKYYIYMDCAVISIGTLYRESRFLTFQDKETAVKFATRFPDLIKKAGGLI